MRGGFVLAGVLLLVAFPDVEEIDGILGVWLSVLVVACCLLALVESRFSLESRARLKFARGVAPMTVEEFARLEFLLGVVGV